MDRPFSEFKNYISFLSNRGRDGKKLNTRREQSQIQKKKKIARRYYRDFPPKKPAPTKQKNIRGSQTSRHYYYYISPPFPRALFFACRPDSAPPVHLFQSELSFCVWESEGGTFIKKFGKVSLFCFPSFSQRKLKRTSKIPPFPKPIWEKISGFCTKRSDGWENKCLQSNKFYHVLAISSSVKLVFSSQTNAPTPPPLSAPPNLVQQRVYRCMNCIFDSAVA